MPPIKDFTEPAMEFGKLFGVWPLFVLLLLISVMVLLWWIQKMNHAQNQEKLNAVIAKLDAQTNATHQLERRINELGEVTSIIGLSMAFAPETTKKQIARQRNAFRDHLKEGDS